MQPRRARLTVAPLLLLPVLLLPLLLSAPATQAAEAAQALSHGGSRAQQLALPWMNAALPQEQRLADLVGRLSTAEKLTQLIHKAPGVHRVGLPGYIYSGTCNHGEAGPDGPQGPRVSTVFPQSLALAESWDLQ